MIVEFRNNVPRFRVHLTGMQRYALIFLFLLFPSLSFGNDAVTKLTCGNGRIEVYNSNVVESPFFVVSIFNSKGIFYHSFLADKEFLEVRCEKMNEGKEILLINHFCGGSGCAESNYIIIDPMTGKVMLEPTDGFSGNANKASSILGKAVKPFSCLKHSRSNVKQNANGEYCLMSPLELG
ncbi:MAG: hypothetical protein HQL08_07255 [Nitrospirae bacterium]|nr:hypothetical protein [Nitrospirota bacterium]